MADGSWHVFRQRQKSTPRRTQTVSLSLNFVLAEFSDFWENIHIPYQRQLCLVYNQWARLDSPLGWSRRFWSSILSQRGLTCWSCITGSNGALWKLTDPQLFFLISWKHLNRIQFTQTSAFRNSCRVPTPTLYSLEIYEARASSSSFVSSASASQMPTDTPTLR